jgi:hypothetical protein
MIPDSFGKFGRISGELSGGEAAGCDVAACIVPGGLGLHIRCEKA